MRSHWLPAARAVQPIVLLLVTLVAIPYLLTFILALPKFCVVDIVPFYVAGCLTLLAYVLLLKYRAKWSVTQLSVVSATAVALAASVVVLGGFNHERHHAIALPANGTSSSPAGYVMSENEYEDNEPSPLLRGFAIMSGTSGPNAAISGLPVLFRHAWVFFGVPAVWLITCAAASQPLAFFLKVMGRGLF